MIALMSHWLLTRMGFTLGARICPGPRHVGCWALRGGPERGNSAATHFLFPIVATCCLYCLCLFRLRVLLDLFLLLFLLLAVPSMPSSFVLPLFVNKTRLAQCHWLEPGDRSARP
ncbi:unnamed protein product [Symbiodinium necroappetens]|uniref:Uncharacterized protein n=1 Tax=Symbiodinium necroappetens TaxID=1628268 RepID=A0A813C9K4_9DINO|nr:unnamed protein product [Symbiodinium necroappetens]